ncbi:MAG: histidinol-phosphate transaminase [Anaerolineae bacterium]|nr:histidinol-phosphate transaminase [Anaerolineae bacterium]
MNFDPNTIIRPNIANLQPYTPILPFEVLSAQLKRQPGDIIKLDANENPYGPSPLVAEALAEAPFLHIYPDPECRALRQALADYTGLELEHLLVGLGADELIDLIMRLFIEPGDAIVNCPPTFGMYAFDADVNGAQAINIWRRPDFSIDLAEIEALFSLPPKEDDQKRVTPKLIFVASPNNPDGSLLGQAELERLLALPAVVVLDEAYVEFSGQSHLRWVKQYDNLIVLRTFSKWAGLAGLRVGYGAFPPVIIEHLWKIKQPYNVPVAGQLAAQVSLSDRERLMGNVAKIIAEREKFYSALAQFSWLKPYPSQTNFVLCKVEGGRRAAEIKQKLAEQGILVRYYQSPGLTDHLRFSIGTPAQMTRLVEVLKQL